MITIKFITLAASYINRYQPDWIAVVCVDDDESIYRRKVIRRVSSRELTYALCDRLRLVGDLLVPSVDFSHRRHRYYYADIITRMINH